MQQALDAWSRPLLVQLAANREAPWHGQLAKWSPYVQLRAAVQLPRVTRAAQALAGCKHLCCRTQNSNASARCRIPQDRCAVSRDRRHFSYADAVPAGTEPEIAAAFSSFEPWRHCGPGHNKRIRHMLVQGHSISRAALHLTSSTRANTVHCHRFCHLSKSLLFRPFTNSGWCSGQQPWITCTPAMQPGAKRIHMCCWFGLLLWAAAGTELDRGSLNLALVWLEGRFPQGMLTSSCLAEAILQSGLVIGANPTLPCCHPLCEQWTGAECKNKRTG